MVAQPEWRISADAAGAQPQDKKKPHNDVEAIIAEATKQRKKLLNDDSSSSDDEGEEEDDEDEGAPKIKKAKKAPKETAAEEVPLVVGIEEAGMHIVLKKILKNDGKRQGTPFGQQLLQSLSPETVMSGIS